MDESPIAAMMPGVCNEVVLRRTRRAWEPIFRAALVVILIAFAALGLFMRNRETWIVAMIAAGILLIFTLRTRPATNTLSITRRGVAYANMFVNIALPWTEIQSIAVVTFRSQNGPVQKVVFTPTQGAPAHVLRGFVSLLTTGSELGLPSTYNLTVDDLVRLLRAWKSSADSAAAPPPDSPAGAAAPPGLDKLCAMDPNRLAALMPDTRDEVILRPPIRKKLWLLLLSIALTAGGIFMVHVDDWRGYPIAGLFGLGTLLFAAMMFPNSTYLYVDRNGLVFVHAFRSHAMSWLDIAEIGTYEMRSHGVKVSDMVGFNHTPTYDRNRRSRALAAALVGYEGALPDTYGLTAQELAKLLIAWKAASAPAETA